ncbi:DUF742 domain-containing protein [Nocardiopsis lambiniae]|uniref:DUF742 domain-containing protein n=1 Tax=Nocardiopsis lambiniae TaxID=3075539 RepID=A0ABU2MCD4_9ACTN|nr:DUF742 domain-containing protein [Nocardiopsis sp. DSM 44743]MDT0330238.1 DUF742 domain-containing protein [Nocardiopsis sp. DSM 44743]
MNPDDHAAGPDLIRPYALTGGRTRPSRSDLTLTTRVVAVADVVEDEPEAREIHALCVRPVTVAEAASRSGLPLGVVRVLLADLVDRGYVMARTPERERHRPDEATLRAVLARVKEL